MNRRHRLMATIFGGASDTVAPTVTITSTTTSPSLNSTVPITMTFSEDVTGFVVGDITITAGGSLASFSATSAKVYTVNWTMVSGANTFDIAAGVCIDAAGNGNTAATQFAMTFGIIPAAITPTEGLEIITNGNFSAWTGGNPDGWTVTGETGATREITEVGAGEGHGGVGTGKMNLYQTGAAFTLFANQGSLTRYKWYRLLSTCSYRGSGNVAIQSPAGLISTAQMTSAGAYNFADIANEGGSITLYVLANPDPTDVTVDDVSLKELTGLSSLVGTATAQDATYTCLPTVTVGNQCGMIICYADANNYVLATFNNLHATGGARYGRLYKVVSGVWTRLINTAGLSYVAGQALTVVVSGTTYKLYYNGSQVGTDQTISGMTGTGVYAFATDGASSPGRITVNPT